MTVRFTGKTWLVIGIALLLILASVPLLISETRSFLLFQFAPAYARDAHLLRLQGKNQVSICSEPSIWRG